MYLIVAVILVVRIGNVDMAGRQARNGLMAGRIGAKCGCGHP